MASEEAGTARANLGFDIHQGKPFPKRGFRKVGVHPVTLETGQRWYNVRFRRGRGSTCLFCKLRKIQQRSSTEPNVADH